MVANPRSKKRLPSPFRLTNARLSVIEILANFGVATRDQIARLHFGTRKPTEHNARQIRQLTADLEREGYVRWLPWLARVYGLTAKGVKEACARDMSDPYELSPEKSLTLVEHDLKRTSTHAAIEALAESMRWKLGWQKTDLYRTVEPDDLFRINDTYVFFELENHKKNHIDLYGKARRYSEYCAAGECLRDWGFRNPHVLFQFATEERMRNFLDYLTGICNCTHYRGTIRHTCVRELRKAPIRASNFLFTHDAAVYGETAGKILRSAADYAARAYSFSEIVDPGSAATPSGSPPEAS